MSECTHGLENYCTRCHIVELQAENEQLKKQLEERVACNAKLAEVWVLLKEYLISPNQNSMNVGKALLIVRVYDIGNLNQQAADLTNEN